LCYYAQKIVYADKLSHVTRGDTGHAPAAFPILIGDPGALGDRDSTNRVVAVAVAESQEDHSIQVGERRAKMSGAAVVVVPASVVVAVAVKARGHHLARESRLP
jgi:hypothetical protein